MPLDAGSARDSGRPRQPRFPIRAALYYAWFPQAWDQRQVSPYTKYRPSLGFYRSGDGRVVRRHVRAMQYAGIDAAIVSWWGRGSLIDRRLVRLLSVTATMRSSFHWSLYYEPEGQGDPSVARIRADLSYSRRRFASRASFLKVGGRFVVFVYADERDGCRMAERWKRANTVGAYLVLKVFPGFRTCDAQPPAWHQYAPAVAEQDFAPWSFSISPGFFAASATRPRLPRDLERWREEIRDMVASDARFQLVTTFNEWGEGTAVESALEWASSSRYGAYLDALHVDGGRASSPPPGTSDPVIAAAGDIACDPSSPNFKGGRGTATTCHQRATSDLLVGTHLNAVLTLGDTQYEDNAYAKYAASFDPSWGRVKALIRPAIGNHEYLTPNAAGYFDYFGPAAGDRSRGYYSFDLGTWHLIALNSECREIGGCNAGSQQERWLRSDLAAHRASCTLAYWHEPRFTSGRHGDAQQMATIWNDLVAAHADVVLSGHDHDYERFVPAGAAPETTDRRQSPVLDPQGIREFVVGTGGKDHSRIKVNPLAGEAMWNAHTFGVLELTLHPRRYDWRFVAEAGKTFADSGSGTCH